MIAERPAPPSAADGPIRSVFADDPEFAPLLEHYRSGVAAKRRALREAVDELPGEIAPLRALAHQIKGSAGGYGYPQITAAAGDLLAACREEDAEAARTGAERLSDLLGRIGG